jgi:hypothetical protein
MGIIMALLINMATIEQAGIGINPLEAIRFYL